ncbi:hypothetical protein NP233_g3367 [Leucocoprinus birnbaumii]|uniref:Uncharacterized protein n=1 Tax=Leucocoprinus birnbaumii TaxID=56174 RepID=A0AAD5VXC6_9AGAR|nr:hypothetical protein NP233_g3367 [Leucocoprinus birnbaumii]
MPEKDAAAETWEYYKVHLEDFAEIFYRISWYFEGTGSLCDSSLELVEPHDASFDFDPFPFETFSYDFTQLGISLSSPAFSHLANSNSESLARLSTPRSLPNSVPRSPLAPSQRRRSPTTRPIHYGAISNQSSDDELSSLDEDVADAPPGDVWDAPPSAFLNRSTFRPLKVPPTKHRRRLSSLLKRFSSFLHLHRNEKR